MIQFFVLGLLSFYLFCTHANPNTSIDKSISAPSSPVETPPIVQKKRSGFFDLKLNSSIQFDEAVYVSSTYGFVIEKGWWFVRPYTLESQINVGGRIPLNSMYPLMSIAFRQEFNGVQNNGINKYIPGVSFSFGGYGGLSHVILEINAGLFYKIFISDHFSLIPEIHFTWGFQSENFWALSLSLRRYY